MRRVTRLKRNAVDRLVVACLWSLALAACADGDAEPRSPLDTEIDPASGVDDGATDIDPPEEPPVELDAGTREDAAADVMQAMDAAAPSSDGSDEEPASEDGAVKSMDATVGADGAQDTDAAQSTDAEQPDASPAQDAAPPITWLQVEPIFLHHCAGCHVVGGPGPFAIDNYPESANHADAIRTRTGDKTMPPCGDTPFPACGLSAEQIELVSLWVGYGARE
jgi:mono/diheme cytochrome c family protein